MRGAAPQGVFGAIKVFGTSSQGLVGPLQLLMGALLDRGHIFLQDRGTLVEQPFSRVQSGIALIGAAFAFVGQSFSAIGQIFAPVGRKVPIIGERFAAVGRTVPIIGMNVAVVGRAVTFLQWGRLFQRVLGGVHTFWPAHPITLTLIRAGVDGELSVARSGAMFAACKRRVLRAVVLLAAGVTCGYDSQLRPRRVLELVLPDAARGR
jgi:hypothetical protein